MFLYCWTEEDAKKVINHIWNDPEAWDKGERSWHTEYDSPNMNSFFFSPNEAGDSFCLIQIRLK